MAKGFHPHWYDGTNAERAAFATAGLAIPFFWYETDLRNLRAWDGTTWQYFGGLRLGSVLRYNATTDTKTYYDTVLAANNAANSGEFILVPPGTWSVEELLLKDAIPILEMFPGSVILSATGGAYAVGTPVASGTYYIAVRRIKMEREHSSDIFAFYGQHASGEGAVLADLRCYNFGSSRAIALGNYGAGTVHYAGDLDVLSDGAGAYAVRNNSTGEIVGIGDAVAGDSSEGFAYFIRNNSTGTVKWRGDADVDTEGSDVYGDYAIGIQNRGGTIEWRGFMDVHAQGAEAIGIQSYKGGGSIDAIGIVRVFGQDGGVNGVVVGHTPDVSTCDVRFRGRLEISTADGAAYGSMMSPTQGNGTIELHADVVAESTSGPAYGVRNDGPGHTTHWNGSILTDGDTAEYDLYQAGGTLEIFSVDYTTIYGEVVVNHQGKIDKYGQQTTASGYFAANGDAQGTYQLTARRAVASHTVNTWYSLYLDGTALQATIPASTAWTVYVSIVGVTQNAAQQWGYELVGLIERDNANNTTLAGQTQRVIFESDANYDAQLVADDTNEALEVQVRRTGGADYDVRWEATIRTGEVSYP